MSLRKRLNMRKRSGRMRSGYDMQTGALRT
jgi:hypothetical protein